MVLKKAREEKEGEVFHEHAREGVRSRERVKGTNIPRAYGRRKRKKEEGETRTKKGDQKRETVRPLVIKLMGLRWRQRRRRRCPLQMFADCCRIAFRRYPIILSFLPLPKSSAKTGGGFC